MVRSESNNVMQAEEKSSRGRVRINYVAAVKVVAGNGSIYRGNLRDISRDSLFVKIERPGRNLWHLNPGTQVQVVLTVHQGDSRLTIESYGKTLRVDDDGVAINFTEPLKWWPVFSVFPQNEQFLFDMVS